MQLTILPLVPQPVKTKIFCIQSLVINHKTLFIVRGTDLRERLTLLAPLRFSYRKI